MKDQEFLDHVEMMADHYIAVLRGEADAGNNPLAPLERFRNLIGPVFIKALIARNKQVCVLKATLRRISRGRMSRADAQELAGDTLELVERIKFPEMREAADAGNG